MVGVIHQTDLYHPHLDADDCWDLACQYALHYCGLINLEGIILDAVPIIRMNHGDPSIIAVSQLNYITGSYISNVIGSRDKFDNIGYEKYSQEKGKFSAVQMIEDKLLNSNEKIAIQIVGGCRDIALALKLFPHLFEEKCKGIYLNGGTSNVLSKTEYNVSLDEDAFIELFKAPCPLYWMPSHYNFIEPYKVEQYATYYKFRQEEILPYLSSNMQKYFMYALNKEEDINWLYYLRKRTKKEDFEKICNQERNMWSTAGILYAAGKVVDLDGNIVDLDSNNGQELYKFQKVNVEKNDGGSLRWNFTEQESNKYIFAIKNIKKYENCMTVAMKNLLRKIP